jgi:hypothetical protein
MATESTGFTIVPKGRIRSKQKPRGRGEILGEYQEMITAIQSVGGDPLPVHGTTKASLPAAGKKADRLYCVNDGNAKGVFLDTGASIVQVAGNDIKSGTTVPDTERADMLFIKTDVPGIYHDNGTDVTKVAELATILPRQIYAASAGATVFDDTTWLNKVEIAVPSGTWTISFYAEVYTDANAWYDWRLRSSAGVSHLGDGIRQPTSSNGNYAGMAGNITFVTSGYTFSLEFKGSSGGSSSVRRAYIRALEYLAGG